MKVAKFSEQGPPPRNEDDLWEGVIRPIGSHLAVLCDGMGGHMCGDEAAKTVVEGICLHFFGHCTQPDGLRKIRNAIKSAGITFEGRARGREMGSTLVMSLLTGHNLYIAHCGDSRAYIFPKNHPTIKTRDHVKLSPEGWPLITNAFFTGRCDKILPEIDLYMVQPGDRVLLCSDGVYGCIPADRLDSLMRSDADLDDIASQLKDWCRIHAHDNHSAILLEI
ncbi:MAG: serine/threonine-protein phosphatase [Bacteroidales bacterium]|nr:serine/threonine-protein phosphatase [Bacteroidales bacterium]